MEIRHQPPIPDAIVTIWQQVVNAAARILGTPSVMINRVRPPMLEVLRANEDPQNPLPSGTTMEMAGVYCELTARMNRPLEVADATKDPRWANSPTAKAGILSYLGYPLCWPDGKMFGTLCTVNTGPKRWTGRHKELLGAFRQAIEAHLALADTLEQLRATNDRLAQALGEVKTLRGLLPICSCCKKIRDDKGYWNQIESYLARHTEASFSHGICPQCMEKHYPDLCVS